MNRQTFLRYLEQPALLSEISLAELQALALEYPYATNIRLLLLLKAKSTDHPAREAYLNRCGTATFDRSYLFDVLRDFSLEESGNAGEVLELLELDELELQPAEEISMVDLPSRINAMTVDEPTDHHQEEAPQRAPVRGTHTVSDHLLKSKFVFSDAWISTAVVISGLTNELLNAGFSTSEVPVVTLRPEDPAVFAARIRRRRNEASLGDRLRKLRRMHEPELAASELDQIVHRSVVDHGAVASETLAALLVKQGQYQNAIKMYRRLILLYPEKKPIFAGLIKELKEKL